MAYIGVDYRSVPEGGGHRIITDDNSLIEGWGNYDLGEISFFNQVNAEASRGGKAVPVKKAPSMCSSIYERTNFIFLLWIFLNLYYFQVFSYQVPEISHWCQVSNFWVQPIKEALWLCCPMGADYATQTWYCQETGPLCRFSREAQEGSPVHVECQTQPPTLVAVIGGIERDVRRRPSQPTADPARLQFSQSSVLLRGGECLETSSAQIVKSKSSPNSCRIVWARIACDWHEGEGVLGVCQVNCTHCGGEFSGMAGAGILQGGWRATIHQRGAQACVIWISSWSRGAEGSYSPYYVSKSYPCRAVACLYLYKQY